MTNWNMDNIMAFCFNKITVLLRQSSALQLRYPSHSNQGIYQVRGARSEEKAQEGFTSTGELWGLHRTPRPHSYRSLEDIAS